MTNLDLSKIAASSFTPGLQTVGTVNSAAYVTGQLPPNAQGSYLSGSVVVEFPIINNLVTWRVNFPSASGDLAAYWFPMTTGSQFLNVVNGANQWTVQFFINSHPLGRQIYYLFSSLTQAGAINFNNWQINIFGNVYTFPF